VAEMILSKGEYNSAINALDNILSQTVESIALTDTMPLLDDVPDSNKAFKGKLTILFVDMRKSTDLTDELKSKKMVKAYRAFIRMIIQGIRYSGGFTRQFAGDGIMGVFQDTTDQDSEITSSQKAVNAARYILTLIDHCLNPSLKKHIPDVTIGCGVGICTGDIMITKVGMRGKEADETSENETGIVWVGSTTNYASRFCGLAAACEIFIDEKTYAEIAPCDEWQKTSRTKGNKLFVGYTASEYYLPLPEDVEISPVKSEDNNNSEKTFVQNIFEETQECALALVDEISKKSAELALALENLKKRELLVKERESEANNEETRLSQWQTRLDSKQSSVDDKDEQNRIDEYVIHRELFSKTFCKSALIKEIGKDFWIDSIAKMFPLGKAAGKSELQVKIDLDCYLVDIYMCFGMYEEAYSTLCIQAQYASWLSISTFEEVVRKSGHWAHIKGILEERCGQNHRDALQKLKTMGY